MAANTLRYSIMDERLYGTLSGKSVSMRAFSGGGRGSTAGKQRPDLAHWSTSKKAPAKYDENNRGGPLPVGAYWASYLAAHPRFGRCAFLGQTLSSLLQRDSFSPLGIKVTDRDDFFIHRRGPKGSDGCIVPSTDDELAELLAGIQAAPVPVLLVVHSEGMHGDKLEAAKALGNVA